jgi:hypothetical protein
MQQEDYLKRQIDQLGRVLGKVLSDLLGLKSAGQVTEGTEAASQALKNGIGLDISDMASIPAGEFVEILRNTWQINDGNLETLAEIMLVFAEDSDQGGAAGEGVSALYERILLIYEYLDQTSSLYSYERHARINRIRLMLPSGFETS